MKQGEDGVETNAPQGAAAQAQTKDEEQEKRWPAVLWFSTHVAARSKKEWGPRMPRLFYLQKPGIASERWVIAF